MLQRRDLLKHGIDIPWKIFVRESCEELEKSTEEKVHRLGFQGDEARAVYEEIIHQESNKNLHLGRLRTLKSRMLCSNTISTSLACNGKTKKNQPPDKMISKVTVNMILKAVEQRDLKFLLKHVTQENVNLTDEFGWTPLMSAAYCGHLDVVEHLLRLGANKRARDKSGFTAAQLALKKNFLSIVALLRKKVESTDGSGLLESRTSVSKESVERKSETRSDTTEPLKDSNGGTCKKSIMKKEQLCYDKGFYCDICEQKFQEVTRKQHETSTLHIFNTKPKLSSTMYGLSKQNKGYQMLLNTGWDEQHGLGPAGKGMKYPIKTCLKTDRKGLGETNEKAFRVTHFKPRDINAIGNLKIFKQRCLKKRDRERLLSRDARKERALRIALS